jgi:hypothetical protein
MPERDLLNDHAADRDPVQVRGSTPAASSTTTASAAMSAIE